MKKLLLSLGAIASVAAPVAAVVACGAPAPKHQDLNIDVIKALAPDLKKAVSKAMGEDENTLDGATSTVVADGENFKVTLTSKGMNVILSVTSAAKVISMELGVGNSATPKQIADVQKVLEGGTIVNTGKADAKNKLVESDYDAAIVATIPDGFPAPLADGASNAEVTAYDTKTDAFLVAYQQAVADEAAKAIKAIVELEVAKTAFTTHAIGDSSNHVLLTEKIMNNLGFKTSDIDTLKKLISDGAIIKVWKSDIDTLLNTDITVNGRESNPSGPAILSSDITTWGTKTIA